MNSRPRVDPLPPLIQVREVSEVDSSRKGYIDPREIRDVGDGVFVADKILSVLQSVVENAVQAFGLAYIALGWVWNSVFRATIEAGRSFSSRVSVMGCMYLLVGLPLHRSYPSMLPRNPLLRE